jgi:preprotein translocase subunit SecG
MDAKFFAEFGPIFLDAFTVILGVLFVATLVIFHWEFKKLDAPSEHGNKTRA